MNTQTLSVLPAEKRHSNVYYALCRGDQETENGKYPVDFKPVKGARTFENSFGLDLVYYGDTVAEGRSGMVLCDKKSFDSVMERMGIEKIEKIIQSAIALHDGLSPRYTRPDEKKSDVFPKQAKVASGVIMAMNEYGKRSKYLKIDEPFFVLEKEKDSFTAGLYVLYEGIMFYIDQRHCMDEAREKLARMNYKASTTAKN